MCNKCLELEAELFKQHNMVEKDEYNKLSKSFSQLEQHCISFELAMQLNKEIFQKNNTSVNQTEPTFDQLFKVNNLKAQLEAKDTTIKKLKAQIKRMSETSTSESVKKDIDEIETISIELEHRPFTTITTQKNNQFSTSSPVKIEALQELPKVSLVNTSLKKLKYHLSQFDNVVKKRITPNALTKGEWGFEHTKAVFQKEIIPFLETLKDIFNVFDKDLLNEVTEVQTVFNQMEAAVQQYHVDKQCFKIQKKQFLIENDRLLDQIISQDIVNIVVNSSVDNNISVNQTGPLFDQLFELNNLKAELQAKDTTIKKLRAHIKRIIETSTSESVKKDFDEIETINIELEHRKKVFVITTLKNDLRKLKGKDIVDNATTIAPGMYKLDPIILAPKVKNNRQAHEYYLKHTMEQVAILREVFEQAKSRNPLDSASYSTCMYVKLIQELLGYVRETCPDIHKPSEKLVAVTPINKKKTVRFVDTVTSSGNIPKVTNRPLLSSTGVNPTTSASGSKPSSNTKNDRISRIPSSNEKNKVEVQSRKVKSSLNKRNSDSKNVCNEHVKHPVKGAKALCSICNECLFDANHAMCLIDHVNSMNVRAKSASKKNKKRKEWKPTSKVFNSVGYKWKPTGRTFTLVGNVCPLTRMELGTSRGSDTSVAPSSSSLIDCRLSKSSCGIWTPDAPST
ncbi:hypothetical protein Tco_0269180 [Tanacetum coccineum]